MSPMSRTAPGPEPETGMHLGIRNKDSAGFPSLPPRRDRCPPPAGTRPTSPARPSASGRAGMGWPAVGGAGRRAPTGTWFSRPIRRVFCRRELCSRPVRADRSLQRDGPGLLEEVSFQRGAKNRSAGAGLRVWTASVEGISYTTSLIVSGSWEEASAELLPRPGSPGGSPSRIGQRHRIRGSVSLGKGWARAGSRGFFRRLITGHLAMGGRESPWILSANSAPFPGADGGPVTQGLVAHHRAFSSFNQISASMRRNCISYTPSGVARAASFRALAIASNSFRSAMHFSNAATISAFPAPAL